MNEDLATGPSTPTRALRAKLLSLGELPLAALVVSTLILAAYGGLFDAWFHPIDDALHLVGVQQGKYPLAHPRPAHFAWNRALFALFGTKATAWHAAGLALHATAACALFVLARSTGAPRVAALAGASVFAVLHAPLSAVAWISAVSGLLVVVFSLLSGLCWWMHLEASAPRARWAWYAVALLALIGAAASKQDCVIVGPLLFGLHVLRDGWREVLKPRALLRYAPFALVGAIYLAIAFDPTIWSNRPGVGEYRFSLELVPRALTNLTVLVWPRHISSGAAPTWMLSAGAALFVATISLARTGRARWQRITWLGLTLALCGLLPVLPGPWEAVAASRLGYTSAIGIALIVAGVAAGALRSAPRALRVATLPVIATGCVVHASSVRSTVAWRFVEASHDYRHLIDTTLTTFDASATGSVLYFAPPVWNELDLVRGVTAFAAGRRFELERVAIPLEAVDQQLPNWSARAEVVTWSRNAWRPLDTVELDRAALQRTAEANATHGDAGMVRATWLRRSDAVDR